MGQKTSGGMSLEDSLVIIMRAGLDAVYKALNTRPEPKPDSNQETVQ